MRNRLCAAIVVLSMAVTPLLAAEQVDETVIKIAAPILIEPDQLQQKLADKNLRLIDVRSESDYAQGHIPGAVRVDVADWKSLAFSTNGLHDVQGWTAKLNPLGLSKGARVVVYGSKISDVARIWWLLKYVGVKHASILNGGWEWWTKTDRPTETSAANVSPSEFKPEFQAERLVELDLLKESLNSAAVKIVDTRSIEEFTGGRIPAAAHLEWKELLAGDGRFKSKSQLQELFHERGIDPAQTAVCYCQSGGRATVDAFALELAGYPKVKVYMHGWSQWGDASDAPVEK